MDNRIRVAIIGVGIGQEHLQAYMKLQDMYDVACLCDINAQRAKDVLESEGIDPSAIEVATDIDAVLARSDIDLIDICLPPHLHFEMSLKALASGKHVVCEKPLATSLKEVDLLIAAEAQSKGTLTPVFQYRYGPEVAKLRALIAAGYAGKPLVASVETHWNRQADYYDNPWRGTWKGEQGGAVLGHAIHNHDLLCTFMGPIAKLHAFLATRVNDIEVEDCASISFQMECGALATSSITLGSAKEITRFRFCFENLTAESDTMPYAPAGGTWTFTARGDAHSQDEIDQFLAGLPTSKVGFSGYLEALAERLQNDGTNAVTLADGRRSIELVTAIYDSARSGETVALPLSEAAPLYASWLP